MGRWIMTSLLIGCANLQGEKVATKRPSATPRHRAKLIFFGYRSLLSAGHLCGLVSFCDSDLATVGWDEAASMSARCLAHFYGTIYDRRLLTLCTLE